MATVLGLLCMAASALPLASSASHAGAAVSQAAAASYEAFLREHGERRGNDTVSYARRVSLFQRTLRAIEKQNADPNANWVAGLNRFADYTDSEFHALLGHKPRMRGLAKAGVVSSSASSSSTAFAPASFIQAGPRQKGYNEIRIDSLAKRADWRDSLATTKQAKDQGGCGSCWAVAAVGAIEAFAERSIGHSSPVSYEQLVDCVPNPNECGGQGGCKGATAELAFEWIHKHGIVAEGDYSGYKKGREGTCYTSSSPVLKAQGFVRLAENMLGPLMKAVSEQGPAVVSVDAGGWSAYKGGIFDSCPRDAKVNHAVLLVGYGHDDRRSKDYWLVRNSWGPTWGEDGGYIRILRHTAGIETDPEAAFCGVDHDPKAGVACKDAAGKYPETMKVCGMCGILSDSSYPFGIQSALAAKQNSDAKATAISGKASVRWTGSKAESKQKKAPFLWKAAADWRRRMMNSAWRFA